MKIKDLELNQLCEIDLVVKSATARETRAKKPYLAIEFFDGTDTINGNYWDWSTGNIPPVNAILTVKAQVSEWQGIKQLNVKSMATCTTKVLADFAPASGDDLAATYQAAYSLMSEVTDETLRCLALGILEDLRPLWLTVPGAVSVHHNYMGGTLIHSYSTAKIAGALAKQIPEANYDLCLVGGMLHDLGKLFAYTINGVSIDMTANGKLYEHSFIGAEFVGNYAESHVDVDIPHIYAKVRLLRHIILSHHGKLEYGAAITPQCIEAYIVSCADGIDATTEQIRVAGNKAGDTMWTDKIYTLNNRPHITPYYVHEAFIQGEETV